MVRKLQVKGNNLTGAREAVGRKVVEVVAAEVQQLRLGGKTTWDFGVTLTLTCGMLGFNLGASPLLRQRRSRGATACSGSSER
ncbi:hypothetical protein INR49_028882 [Caranx melampygus]|nr:hypothetical protein INR49_028882 [Caranx melampygus]